MRLRWSYQSPLLLGFLSAFDPTGRLLRSSLPSPGQIRLVVVDHEGWAKRVSRRSLEVAAVGFQRLAGLGVTGAADFARGPQIPQPRGAMPPQLGAQRREA